MPFNITSFLLQAEIGRFLPGSKKMLDLLNQRVDLTDSILDFIIERRDSYDHLNFELLHKLRSLTYEARKDEIDMLYQALGYSPWLSVDAHAFPQSVVADLNEPLTHPELTPGSFNVIINNGTTEHIFNQYQVYKSIHDLCSENGLMWHKIPTTNILNIFYYGATPIFLYELAKINQYEILQLGIANRWGNIGYVKEFKQGANLIYDSQKYLPAPKLTKKPWYHFSKKSAPKKTYMTDFDLSLEEFLTKAPLENLSFRLSSVYHSLTELGSLNRPGNSGEIYIIALFRKKSTAEFKVPFQNKFYHYIDDPTMKEKYRND
jgi:hypothetical protein